jgi:hypothetical protein
MRTLQSVPMHKQLFPPITALNSIVLQIKLGGGHRLNEKNVSFHECAVKVELLTEVRRGLITSDLARESGSCGRKIPPYHCSLNLIRVGVEPGKGLRCETQGRRLSEFLGVLRFSLQFLPADNIKELKTQATIKSRHQEHKKLRSGTTVISLASAALELQSVHSPLPLLNYSLFTRLCRSSITVCSLASAALNNSLFTRLCRSWTTVCSLASAAL